MSGIARYRSAVGRFVRLLGGCFDGHFGLILLAIIGLVALVLIVRGLT